MARRTPDRWRCLTVGCNPKLKSQGIAEQHRDQTSHRVARWPVRSAEGQQKQRERNRLAVGLSDHEICQLESELGWDEHKHASP